MSIDKKKVLEEEHKKIWAKPIVNDNRTFDQAQIEDFWALFNLYADNRRQADVREIVTTARTLGFDKSHEFIYQALLNIAESLEGEWIDFEQFLTMLTEAIGNPYTEEGRRQAFMLADPRGEERIPFDVWKKMAHMLKLNMNEDQISESIQNIAGKGKQSITWEQFNAFLAKKMEKKKN